jgi:hypothetical protein
MLNSNGTWTVNIEKPAKKTIPKFASPNKFLVNASYSTVQKKAQSPLLPTTLPPSPRMASNGSTTQKTFLIF